jgi:hypothetical protein
MGAGGEFRARGFVIGCIAGLHNVFTTRPEQFEQADGVVLLGRIDKSLHGLLGRGESLLAILRRGVRERECRRKRG